MPRILAIVLISALALVARAEGEPDKKALRTWRATCATCHGASGRGDTEQGRKLRLRDMSAPDWQRAIADEQIRERIKTGFKDGQGDALREMPAFDGVLLPDVIDALVRVVRGHEKK